LHACSAGPTTSQVLPQGLQDPKPCRRAYNIPSLAAGVYNIPSKPCRRGPTTSQALSQESICNIPSLATGFNLQHPKTCHMVRFATSKPCRRVRPTISQALLQGPTYNIPGLAAGPCTVPSLAAAGFCNDMHGCQALLQDLHPSSPSKPSWKNEASHGVCLRPSTNNPLERHLSVEAIKPVIQRRCFWLTAYSIDKPAQSR
jgi:hypothetical protein